MTGGIQIAELGFDHIVCRSVAGVRVIVLVLQQEQRNGLSHTQVWDCGTQSPTELTKLDIIQFVGADGLVVSRIGDKTKSLSPRGSVL